MKHLQLLRSYLLVSPALPLHVFFPISSEGNHQKVMSDCYPSLTPTCSPTKLLQNFLFSVRESIHISPSQLPWSFPPGLMQSHNHPTSPPMLINHSLCGSHAKSKISGRSCLSLAWNPQRFPVTRRLFQPPTHGPSYLEWSDPSLPPTPSLTALESQKLDFCPNIHQISSCLRTVKLPRILLLHLPFSPQLKYDLCRDIVSDSF